MTFDEWWDTSKAAATPETFAGWEQSCRQAWAAAMATDRPTMIGDAQDLGALARKSNEALGSELEKAICDFGMACAYLDEAKRVAAAQAIWSAARSLIDEERERCAGLCEVAADKYKDRSGPQSIVAQVCAVVIRGSLGGRENEAIGTENANLRRRLQRL